MKYLFVFLGFACGLSNCWSASCFTSGVVALKGIVLTQGSQYRLYVDPASATSCSCSDGSKKYVKLPSSGVFVKAAQAVVTNAILSGQKLKLKISDGGTCNLLEVMTWNS